MRATRLLWIAAIVSASACATAPEAPPRIPELPLAGMETELSTLTIEHLARDASDPASLASLLEEAGFRSGSERTYAGPGERFSLAVTRVLSFGDTEGAETYLSWLREHPSEFLGTVERLPPLDLPGAPFLTVHLPGGCCPKEVPVYLAAWRRGSSVVSVRVSGRGLDGEAVRGLVAQIDTALREPADA